MLLFLDKAKKINLRQFETFPEIYLGFFSFKQGRMEPGNKAVTVS